MHNESTPIKPGDYAAWIRRNSRTKEVVGRRTVFVYARSGGIATILVREPTGTETMRRVNVSELEKETACALQL